MAPQVGFEPTTYRLTADCSTAELLWNNVRNPTALPTHRRAKPKLNKKDDFTMKI